MSKIVAVGEEVLISGFKGIGAELISINSSNELGGVLERLTHDTAISIIMVTETIAVNGLDAISRYREKNSAIILLIPAHTGSINLGLKEMRDYVKKTTGTDLLK